MADRAKRIAAGAGLERFMMKPKGSQRTTKPGPPVVAITEPKSAGSPAVVNSVSKKTTPRNDSLAKHIVHAKVDLPRQEDSKANADESSSIQKTLRSDRHDATNSVSDIVNYESLDEKASTLRFLKQRDGEGIGETEQETNNKDDRNDRSDKKPDNESMEKSPETPPLPDSINEPAPLAKVIDSPSRQPDSHLQEVRASAVPMAEGENVVRTSEARYSVHDEDPALSPPLSPPVEENEANDSVVQSQSRVVDESAMVEKMKEKPDEIVSSVATGKEMERKAMMEKPDEAVSSVTTRKEMERKAMMEKPNEAVSSVATGKEMKQKAAKKRPDEMVSSAATGKGTEQKVAKEKPDETISSIAAGKETAKKGAEEGQIYETYEDFVASIKTTEPELKPIASPPNVPQNLQPNISQNVPLNIVPNVPPENPKEKEDFKLKAVALEKARLEAKERHKKQELELLKQKAKEKETKLKKKNAAIKIQHAYRKSIMLKQLNAIHAEVEELNKKKEVAGRKIVRAMAKWNERRKEEGLMKRYMDHCASLIQETFRKHRDRLIRAQARKDALAKRQTEQPTAREEEYHSEVYQQSDGKQAEEKSGEEREQYDDEDRLSRDEEQKSRDPQDQEDIRQRSVDSQSHDDPAEEIDEIPIKSATTMPHPIRIKPDAFENPKSGRKPAVLLDDRPIKSLGNKTYNLEEALKTEMPPSEPAKPKTGKRQFLKRKEVYDPRKAIEATKRTNPPCQDKPKGSARSKSPASKENDGRSSKGEENDNKSGTSGDAGKSAPTSHRPKPPNDDREIKPAKETQLEEELALAQESGSPQSSKPKQQFLKRKSKKVETRKVVWGKVARRIDCWNPKQKGEQEKTQPRGREAVMPAHRQMQKAKGGKSGRARIEKKKQRIPPVMMRGESEEMGGKQSVQELYDIYVQYHGDNQGSDEARLAQCRHQQVLQQGRRKLAGSCADASIHILQVLHR